MGGNIPDFQSEDVLAFLIKLSDSGFFSLIDCLPILLLGLLFLLDNSFDPGLPKLCSESVDTGIGGNGEVVLHLKKLIGGVGVVLSEINVGDGIGNLKVIVGNLERGKTIVAWILLDK